MKDDLMFDGSYLLIRTAESLGASDAQVERLQNLLDTGASEITMRQNRVVKWKAGKDAAETENLVTFTAISRF